MNYILTFIQNGQTFRTGHDSIQLVERAQIRAKANGATFAEWVPVL